LFMWRRHSQNRKELKSMYCATKTKTEAEDEDEPFRMPLK